MTTTTPHLQNIIKSNLQPPDDIMPIVATELAANQFLIKQQINKSNGLRFALEAIIKEQGMIQNTLKQYRAQNLNLTSLSAPYRKTPPEIISRIFQLLLPEPPYRLPLPSLQDWLASLNAFTHVCKLWRNIAIGDPLLWKRLDLNIPTRKTKFAAHILKRWLSYMQWNNLHLTIYNNFYTGISPDLNELYKQFDGCKRLKILHLYIGHQFPKLHLQAISHIKMPELESFKLEQERYTPSLTTNHIYTLQAPKLVDLSLYETHPHHMLGDPILLQITTLQLHLNTLRLTHYLDFLRSCLNLIKCTITICGFPRGISGQEGTEVVLPHLTHLTIDMHSSISGLLYYVSAPALQVLNVSKLPIKNLKICPLLPFVHKTTSLLEIHITGLEVTKEQNDFDRFIQTSHPHTITTWKDTRKRPRFHFETDDSGSETELDSLQQYASGPEELISQAGESDSD
jgi:hypothetical protein